ncbi:MAG: ankyrin repeat domain-containing protein [Chthonomonadetes bacterium]|nr:ankyrin repeat domain-containing protein [Chthonomonadetes bacterium]
MESNVLMQEMLEAIDSGRVMRVRKLLEEGLSVNARNDGGETPLHIAVNYEKPRIVRALLKAGADVNARDNWDYTPLHIAVENGNARIVELLIAAGADLNAQNRDGHTPLHIALEQSYPEIARILIGHGANTEVRDNHGFTPLQWAAMVDWSLQMRHAINTGDAQKLREILASGISPNTPNRFGVFSLRLWRKARRCWHNDYAACCGESFLHMAVRCGNVEMVQILLDAGADPNVQAGWKKNTPLHEAAREGKQNIAEVLIAGGADVNARDRNGQTPLHIALENGFWDFGFMLVCHGADPEIRDNQGFTSIQWAARVDCDQQDWDRLNMETCGIDMRATEWYEAREEAWRLHTRQHWL